MLPSKTNKLCCEINPCYKCEACGFKECDSHWDERKIKGLGYHFRDIEDNLSEAVCSATGMLVSYWGDKNNAGISIFHKIIV